jgi:septal ring factor EnvC (AmiA/AmiB activator)
MRFLVFLVCATMMASPVLAETKRAELKKVETDLQQQRAHVSELQTKSADLAKKLDEVRGKMVQLAHEMQAHEQAVLKLRQARAATEQQIDATKKQLDDQRESLAQIIMAMQRLDRVPSQALLLRPSAPIDMARSFKLLREVIPAVSAQAEEIKTTFAHLTELHQTQDVQEQQLLSEQNDLKKKQDDLETLLKKRQVLLAQTKAEQEAGEAKQRDLAGQAKDLHDLLDRVAQHEATVKAQHESTDTIKAPKTEIQDEDGDDVKPVAKAIVKSLSEWFGKLAAHFRLPVAGSVAVEYGQALPGGGTSQGLTINAAPGAIVTAPADGVVRFAGPFRQYKLLVIIQHGTNEHSLLGGMQELYTTVGAHVSAGEPLGKLPKLEGDSSGKASLYYERRRNGKAVDPRH